MKKWLQFGFVFDEDKNEVLVTLYEHEMVAGSSFSLPKEVANKTIKVRDINKVDKISSRVGRIKKDMLKRYHNNRRMKDFLNEACDEWSREKIMISDGQLEEIINKIKNGVKFLRVHADKSFVFRKSETKGDDE